MYIGFLLLDVSRLIGDIPATFLFLPDISGHYIKIILPSLLSLYSESAGRLSVIYMFYWYDRLMTFLQTYLSLGGSVAVIRWVIHSI